MPLFMFILVLIKLFNRFYVLLIDRRVTRAHMLIPVSCHYYVHAHDKETGSQTRSLHLLNFISTIKICLNKMCLKWHSHEI
jgi:hypothetical protein